MRVNVRVYTILCLLLLIPLSLGIFSPVSAVSTRLSIVQTYWGLSADKMIEAYPGDLNVPLTVSIINLNGTYTINGIRATLWLPAPNLTDANGGSYSNASYSSSTGVSPGTAFPLIFRLNINATASPATYNCTLQVKCLAKTPTATTWEEGTPQNLTVRIPVLGKAMFKVASSGNILIAGGNSSISVSVSNVGIGAATNVEAILSLPMTLTSFGSNKWRFPVIAPMTAANLSTYIFAPQSTAGTVSQATLSLTYQTPYGSLRTEIYSIGLMVKMATVTPLNLSFSKTDLMAGMVNNISFTITNTRSTPLTSLDVVISLATPLTVKGESRWHSSNIPAGQGVSFGLQLDPPASAIGSTSLATLSISYQDEFGNIRTDTHTIGLRIRGKITMVAYDISVNPQPVSQKSSFTVSGSLLNKGNIIAQYANASILSGSPFTLLLESTVYIGDIAPNSPVVFSLSAQIGADVAEGTYPVQVWVSYEDELSIEHRLTFTTYITVQKAEVDTRTQTFVESVYNFIMRIHYLIAIAVFAVVLAFVLLRSRRRVTPQYVKPR